MSDDLTDRIDELLKRRVRCGRTADRYLVGGEARPLLAEARGEITRLREGIREHKRDALCNGSLYARERIEALWALLDAPSTQPEGDT